MPHKRTQEYIKMICSSTGRGIVLSRRFACGFAALLCVVVLGGVSLAGPLSLDDIEIWAGNGADGAVMVMHWSAPHYPHNTQDYSSHIPTPIPDVSMAWGYRFDGTGSYFGMLAAVAAADPRLYYVNHSGAIVGIGYDLDNDGQYGLQYFDGSGPTYTQDDFVDGLLNHVTVNDVDYFPPTDDGDLYWGGWYGPNWEPWSEEGGVGGFTHTPDRGPDEFWTGDPWGGPGAHGQWAWGGSDLQDGSCIGWSVAPAGFDFMNGDVFQAWMEFKQAPIDPVPAPLGGDGDDGDGAVPVAEPIAVMLLGLGGLGLRRRRA
jgi:MYXO-CTERM domain-containing protein